MSAPATRTSEHRKEKPAEVLSNILALLIIVILVVTVYNQKKN